MPRFQKLKRRSCLAVENSVTVKLINSRKLGVEGFVDFIGAGDGNRWRQHAVESPYKTLWINC